MSNDKNIHYLLIHGAGGTKSKWRNLVPHLPEGQVTAIDLPGRGTSEAPLPTTIQEHAQLISEQVTEPTIVIGHSMGGLIGIELAALNENVKGLVFVSSFYELPVHPKILAEFDAGTFPDSIFYASYTSNIAKDLLQVEEQEKEEANMEVVSTDFHACNEYKAGKESLATLDIPILSVYGEDDRLLPPKSGEKLTEVNKNIEVHEIEGERHYIMLESPELVSKLIESFVQNNV